MRTKELTKRILIVLVWIVLLAGFVWVLMRGPSFIRIPAWFVLIVYIWGGFLTGDWRLFPVDKNPRGKRTEPRDPQTGLLQCQNCKEWTLRELPNNGHSCSNCGWPDDVS